MSQLPPDPPPPSLELNYETPMPPGNASILLRLAAIFNFITGGLDLLNVFLRIGMILLLLYVNSHPAAGAGRPFLARGPGPFAAPPPVPRSQFVLQIILQSLPGVFSLFAGSLKLLAGFWFLNTRRGTWGVGLAAGIVGCLEVWSCPCCFIHLATGIYTIIILCHEQVCTYLRSLPT